MEKYIALAKHLGLEILEFEGSTFLGTSIEDFNEVSGSNYKDVEEIDSDNEIFIDWLYKNATLIQDEIINTYGEVFEYVSQEYLVVTDEEADDLWEEDLDHYLEECIYPELKGNLKNYFDDEAWKSDARQDGRAHILNRYDGSEDSEEVEGTIYYIYRQN